MPKIDARFLNVEQGSKVLFSDFENDGPMWSGHGPRATRMPVRFSQKFRIAPVVQVSMTMWDMDKMTNPRADISAERITPDGFEIVFKTWGDTRVARVRASWFALGEHPHEDDWELY